MKMTATLQIPRIDIDRYKKKIAEELIDVVSRAAFEWIGAATAEIPVWSGASHATFLHLAREVGFNLSITEAGNAPRRVSYGLRNSTGHIETQPDLGKFSFTYETDLKHLVYNEYHNANIDPDPGLLAQLLNPGPYNFQSKAEVAALRVLEDAHLPDVRPFIRVTIKRV